MGELPAEEYRPAPPRWSRLRRAVFVGVTVLLALLVLGVGGVLATVQHFSEGLPSVEQLKKGYDPPQLTRILAKDGTVLADVFTERRTLVPFSEVPDHAKLAFLAAEDASF